MDNFIISSLVNWLHLMATVAWIGGMVTNFTLVLPSMAKALDPPTAGKFMGIMMKKYRVMVYLAIVVLILTGFAIAGGDEEFGEYFDFSKESSTFFAIKHIMVLLMVVLTILAFEVVGPRVAKVAAAGPSPKLAAMQAQQKTLGMIGLIIGMVIVLLSAMM